MSYNYINNFKESYISNYSINNMGRSNVSFRGTHVCTSKTPQENKKSNKVLLGTLFTGSIFIFGALAFLYKKGYNTDCQKNFIECIKDGWNNVFKIGNAKNISETPKKNLMKDEVKFQSNAKDTSKIEVINKFKDTKCQSKPVQRFNSLEDAIKDYNLKISSKDYDKCNDAEKFLSELVPQKYGKDKSYIEVSTRTRTVDFSTQTLDIENNTVQRGRITSSNDFKTPNMPGNYLISNLSDGRKVVGLCVPSGRSDEVGRPIRTMITTISKDNEYTPLQKDLIEIISQRKGLENFKETDILSLGTICKSKAFNSYDSYEINTDIFLASIKTAKEKLNKKQIDREFISKALNLKNGEKLEKKTF